MFSNCPQLIQLTLDDCGVTDTISIGYAEGDGRSKGSIFFGLTRLRYLSMKDNAIEAAGALLGVSACVLHLTSSIESSLLRIDISGNPLCETASELKAAHAVLVEAIPSLRRIDGAVLVRGGGDHCSLKTFVATSVHCGHGLAVTDSMEKEFSAAVRGERDTSVIS